MWVLTTALVWKHAPGACLALGAMAMHLRDRVRDALLRGLIVVQAARTVALFAMLETAQTEFWTGVSVLSDLAHALIALVAAGAMWAAHHASHRLTAPLRLRG